MKGRLLKEENLFCKLQLSEEDFDKKGDIEFAIKRTAQEQIRGYFPYFQPAGWIRYGLNVKKYLKDDKWFAMDGNPGEWAIMYHGVGDPLGLVRS